MLREVDGSIGIVHETHRTGLFSSDVWFRLLTEVGFAPETLTEVTTEDRAPRGVFTAGVRTRRSLVEALRPTHKQPTAPEAGPAPRS